MTWCIYYADGSWFSSEQGQPWDCPKKTILYIWQANGDHCFNENYYFYHLRKDQWMDVDVFGLIDWLVDDALHVTVVRAGRRVPKAEWKHVMALVNQRHG